MCDYLSFGFYNTQLKSATYVSRVDSFFQIKTFYLNEKVDKTKGQDYDQKNWSREANGSDGSQNATERSQEHNQSHGNLIIDCADILREAVHDPPQGSGLKKWHGGVQDILKKSMMQIAWRNFRSNSQAQGWNECAGSL